MPDGDRSGARAATSLTTRAKSGTRDTAIYFSLLDSSREHRVNIEPKRRSWDWATRNVPPGVRNASPLADPADFWRAMTVRAFRFTCGMRTVKRHKYCHRY